MQICILFSDKDRNNASESCVLSFCFPGGNVMVQEKEDKLQVRLFDFGLAKRITSLSDLGGGEGRNEELPSLEKVHEYELSKKRIQDDLGNALRILIELYAGVTFQSIYEMKQDWKVALECVSVQVASQIFTAVI